MRITVFLVYICLTMAFIGSPSYAGEDPAWTLFPPNLAIGQVGLFSVYNMPGTAVAGSFLNRPVYFHGRAERFLALLPVDLNTSPGTYPLRIDYRDVHGGTQKTMTIDIQVHGQQFSVEELRLPERMVTFPAEVVRRILDEKKTVEAILEKSSEEPFWAEEFIKPVEGDIIGAFGSRRILNGKERSPHLGIDIRAKEGMPVFCVNNGYVALVGDFYLLGRTVIIDHGQGIFTIYCHLSKILVKEGDVVSKGKSLGEVGTSGRATGPHLHWVARISGARVDPLSLLEATATLAEGRR